MIIASILNYAGLIIGTLSIAATIYFAVRYAERKEPHVHALTVQKVGISPDAPQDIQIHYRGTKVDRISSTTLWFWNAGKKPIRETDIIASQPLVVHLTDPSGALEILDVNVRKVSRPAINFSAHKTAPSTIQLTFDFLDQRDGACVEIQHTGPRQTGTTVSGVILGAPRGVRVTESRGLRSLFLLPLALSGRRGSRRSSRLALLVASTVLVVFFVGMAVLAFQVRNDIETAAPQVREALRPHLSGNALDAAVRAVEANAKFKTANRVGAYFMIAVLLLNALAGLLMFWKSGYPFPASLLPDDPASQSGSADTVS